MRQVVVRPEAEPGMCVRESAERSTPGLFLRLTAKLLQRCTVRNERLQVCETVSLGGRRSIALIECDGQRFLAGMSAGAVDTLIAVADASQHRGDLR